MDHRLAYDDVGQGLPVLLIHGFPLDRRMWRPQIGPLTAAGWRLLLPDLRGFGESPPGEEPFSMDLFADDLVRLLDYLGLERSVVGGMSMGGYVLLNLLERHPERVAAAVFLCTRAGADDEAGKQRRDEGIEAVRRGERKRLAGNFEQVLFAEGTLGKHLDKVREVRTWMEDVSDEGLIGGLRAMRDRPDSTLRLATFPQPSLVVGADQDRAAPPEQAEILDRGLPQSRLCWVEGAGHLANLEQPERTNACLLDFLRTLYPRADRGGVRRGHGS